MNENKFISSRSHVRVKFTPLTTKCQLVCLTPMSPCTQVSNTTISPIQYEPDRTLTPTVIFPDVRANDVDGVFPHGSANEYLSLDSIEWLVDDEPISDKWSSADYSINTSDSDLRGALTVKKNIAPSEKYVLRFRGEFYDWRTGVIYQVESDAISLTCTDKGESRWSCSVDKPLVCYDPVYDPLLLYDFKVARGLAAGNKPSGDKCYNLSVNVLLTNGTDEMKTLPTGVTMVLYDLDKKSTISSGVDISAAYPKVTLDMRMIAKRNIEVRFMKEGSVIASSTIGIERKCSMPSQGGVVYQSDITPNMEWYQNGAFLNMSNRAVDYPECYFLITWYSRASIKNSDGTWGYSADKKWQLGDTMGAWVADLGVGHTVNDANFDVWFDVKPHDVCSLLTDENGNVLTDEKGNQLIG